MKSPPSIERPLSILIVASAALFSPCRAADSPPNSPADTDPEKYVKASQAIPDHYASRDLKQKIIRLWSDCPDYATRLTNKKNAKKSAKVLSMVAPVPPVVTALPGENAATFVVTVSFVVSETGIVEAARVLESADPRYNQSALEAVSKWKFSPAEDENGPTKMFFLVPINFNAVRAEDVAIGLAIGRPSRVASTQIYMSGPHSPLPPPPPSPPTVEWSVDVQLQGPSAVEVKAGRIIITHAADDTGKELHSAPQPTFYHPAVGSISSDDLVRTPSPRLGFTVDGASPEAKKIISVEGRVELVIPPLDPAATATIEVVAARVGLPVDSPELRAAGVTLVVFDQTTCDRYGADQSHTAGGPQDYDSGDLFGPRPKWAPPRIGPAPAVTDRDLAIGISDPQGMFVGLEFQTADGKPLRYDHNGWYHSADTDPPKKRFDVYRFESRIPADAKLVCWLITPRSLFSQPLKIAELPLPGRK